MTNWTIFKIIFFHFYLYSSVLSHIYFLHIKNPLYNVKKTSNIEKTLFSLYFWGAVFSKITNSNAQKWVIFRKKIFSAKLVLDTLATFWGACFLKCHRRPILLYILSACLLVCLSACLCAWLLVFIVYLNYCPYLSVCLQACKAIRLSSY